MTQTQAQPHILIAVDLPLTEAVYGRLDGGEPVILAVNPLILPRPAPSIGIFKRASWAAEGDIYPLSLDAHVLEGKQWLTNLYCIGEAMESARQRFELPKGAPVVAAVAGNETTLWAAVEQQDVQASLLFNRILLDEMILKGRAASFLGAVLEEIDGLDLRYLANAVEGLTPTPLGKDYGDLVDEARRAVGSLQPTTKVRGSSGLLLKVPASPRIYVSTGAEWTLLPPAPSVGDPSATIRAIAAFREERRRQGRWLRGMLVNVLAEDLSLHSPADPPYITWSERSEATAAGIEAILLDARVGIVCPPDSRDAQEGDLMPVDGV